LNNKTQQVNQIKLIKTNILDFFVSKFSSDPLKVITTPAYSYRGDKNYDLFGLLDAFLTMYILDSDDRLLSQIDYVDWFNKILEFQNDGHFFIAEEGTFHVKEHVTAYAVAILKLISTKNEHCLFLFDNLNIPQQYINLIKRSNDFKKWITLMGLELPRFNFKKSLVYNLKYNSKRLGWHNIWPGSHVGGGVPAVIGMLRESLVKRNVVDDKELVQFFDNYIQCLDERCSNKYGIWKRGIFDLFYPFLSYRDIGGAAHFLWIYDYLGYRYRFPEKIIKSCLKFQGSNGLVKKHPFCIDFDFTYLLNHSMEQINDDYESIGRVDNYMYKNYLAIIQFYSNKSNFQLLHDTHSIPGALASLVEIEKYFIRRSIFDKLQFNDPFKHICWL